MILNTDTRKKMRNGREHICSNSPIYTRMRWKNA